MQRQFSQNRVIQGRFVGGPGRFGVVQARSDGKATPLPHGLVNLGGGGQPLPDGVRQKMETIFKADFSDVRVHVGTQAPAIGALAFTLGSNLYFAPGQYNPETTSGQQLLGHELTHVLQQRTGRVRNPFGSGVAVVQDPLLEAEADRMGLRAAAHMAVPAAGTVQGKHFNATNRGAAPPQGGSLQLARNYPPISNATAIARAEATAGVWNAAGQVPNPYNCGNQGAEYITAHQITSLKQQWSGKPNLYGFARRASDSASAIGAEVDLKLGNPGAAAAFNYHVAVDTQAVSKPSARTRRKIRQQIRDARDSGQTISQSLISGL